MRPGIEARRRAQAKRAINEALWALAFRATGRASEVLPRGLQPIGIGDALPRAYGGTDHHAKVRAQLCTQLLLEGAGEVSGRRLAAVDEAFVARCADGGTPAAGVCGRDEANQTIRDAFESVAPPLQIGRSTARELPEQVEQVLAREGRPPCTAQSSESDFNARTLQTDLTASVRVFRPLAELAPLLDPQGWDRCSDLFADTHRVVASGGTFAPATEPLKDPDKWTGLLYERAAVGPQEVENILDVSFLREPRRVRVTYDLYRSISYSLGGMRLPGVMRQNYGYVEAVPDRHDARITHMTVVKTIRYDRLSSWSGSQVIDVGEIANYLAPGFLTLWFYDLTRIVPCCETPRADPSGRGKESYA